MPRAAPVRAGRYVLHGLLGAGGMATVHLAKLEGPGRFARVVAVKRLHPHLAEQQGFAAHFLDEARLPSSIRHANVVQTLDVVVESNDCLIVMEYVAGETLSRLLQVACKKEDPPPAPIIVAVISGVLHGLHAAHQTRTRQGEQLGLVHRDVSPQNILVGADGVARIMDFGIAKAVGQDSVTPGERVRGKISYMAPEQVRAGTLTPRTDVFATAVVLWEALLGRRLFLDTTDAATLQNVLSMPVEPPSAFVPGLPATLDRVVLRGLERDPNRRFASAREMADALEETLPLASPTEVGAWVEELAHDALAARAAMVEEVEQWTGSPDSSSDPAASPSTGPLTGSRPPLLRSRWLILVGAGLLLLVPGLMFGLSHRASSSTPLSPTAEPSAVEEPPTEPATQAQMPPTSSPATSHPMRTPLKARAPSASARCSPPYVYDSAGHKVYKPECF
jgi:serine/threonine protein kinase